VVRGDGGDPRKVRRITIGFTAVPSLLTRKVAGATAFWNAEGVTLRRRGFRSREFRVDDYGAPRYPELVLVARRETVTQDPELIRDSLAALRDGTRAALADRAGAARLVADAAQAREALIRAQVDAVAPALEPPIRLDEEALRGWAEFDERFGILKSRPDVERAFDPSLTR
jgi:NitT/TauT family transport system substrate-binding protein/putative hydroxymethylpyrimidine transport system substrate-binding protein